MLHDGSLRFSSFDVEENVLESPTLLKYCEQSSRHSTQILLVTCHFSAWYGSESNIVHGLQKLENTAEISVIAYYTLEQTLCRVFS